MSVFFWIHGEWIGAKDIRVNRCFQKTLSNGHLTSFDVLITAHVICPAAELQHNVLVTVVYRGLTKEKQNKLRNLKFMPFGVINNHHTPLAV